jgi:hypothetical protein
MGAEQVSINKPLTEKIQGSHDDGTTTKDTKAHEQEPKLKVNHCAFRFDPPLDGLLKSKT